MTDNLFSSDRSHDLAITRTERRANAGGTWVRGTIYGHRFDALVFAEHADSPEYEIGQSRVSKLWIKRLADGKTVFNWDRGPDVTAADGSIEQEIVNFLAEGLADLIYRT